MQTVFQFSLTWGHLIPVLSNVVVFDYHFAELSQRWKEKEKKNMTWQIDILNISLWQIPNTAQNGIVLFFFEKWTGIWTGRIMLRVSFFVADSFIPSSQNTTTVSSSVNHCKWHSQQLPHAFSQRFLAHLSKWFSNLDIVLNMLS